MKKALAAFALLCALTSFAPPSRAQTSISPSAGSVVYVHFPGAPTGNCTTEQQAKNEANGDFYVCFAGAWVKVNGTGTGLVASVFGRTGAVVAASGDYTLAQIAAGVAPVGMFDFSASTLTLPSSFNQFNGTPLGAQTGLNHANSSGAGGLVWSNPGGGINISASLANIAGGGATATACTLTSPTQKDFLVFNGSSICVNQTPGVTITDKSSVNTTSYTLVSLDRGNAITRKAAGAMTDTLAQAGSAGFGSSWYGLLDNVDTVNSDTVTPTTSTINGQSTLVVTPNTWCNLLSDNSNWKTACANWVKPGTNMTVVYNADGSTTFNVTSTASRLDQLTSATATNTLANGNFAQIWGWAQTTDAQAAALINDTSAATGGTVTSSLANQSLLKLATASGSTETPLFVSQGPVTGTVAFPGAQLQCTWNNAGLVGRCVGISVVQTANAGGSWPFFINTGVAGATNVFNINTAGDITGNTLILASGTASIAASSVSTSLNIIAGGNDNNFAGTIAAGFFRSGKNSNTTAGSAGGATNVSGGDETGSTANSLIGGALNLNGGKVTLSTSTGSTGGNVPITGGSCVSIASANACPGKVQIINPSFSTGTAAVNDLACVTAQNTIASCSATGTGQFVGVIDTSVTNQAFVLSLSSGGTHTFNATSTAFTAGDYVCQSTAASSGNLVVDNASTVCPVGRGVGIVAVTATTTTPTVWMRPY